MIYFFASFSNTPLAVCALIASKSFIQSTWIPPGGPLAARYLTWEYIKRTSTLHHRRLRYPTLMSYTSQGSGPNQFVPRLVNLALFCKKILLFADWPSYIITKMKCDSISKDSPPKYTYICHIIGTM